MRSHLVILMLLTVTWTDNWWTLSWTPNSENRWVRLIYQCVDPHETSKRTFWAANVFEIQDGVSRMDISRIPLDKSQRCIVFFDIVRHWNPQHESYAERVAVEVKD